MKPVELYRFVQGETITTLTSSDTAVVYNLETYTPAPLGRSGIELKNELSKANIEVKFALDNAVARGWMNAVTEEKVSLTLFSQNESTTSVIWKGRMAAIRPGLADITFVFESIFTSLRRPGLRARYQIGCRHALYQRGCNLDKAAHAVAATVTAATGLVLTVPAAAGFPDGEFFTGMLEVSDGTFRQITKHTGSSVTLSRAIPSLSAALLLGDVAVTLYPGCNRTRTRCIELGNLPNYGGMPFIPIRNPFDGSSIV